MQQVLNFINGRFVAAGAGAGSGAGTKWIDDVDPATGKVHAQVASSDKTDVQAAVDAAKAAFPTWSKTPAIERSRILVKTAELLEKNLERFALAESEDAGKPITATRTIDIPRSAANIRHFGTLVPHLSSEWYDSDGGGVPGGVPSINYTMRRARGVAGIISPWNYPLHLLTWKISPALAVGSTVVAKPSEVTPRTASMLCELLQEAGLPAGVFNVVHGLGTEAGGSLVTHPDVPTVSFTGSTKVGQWIAQNAGAMLKRVSLELGGKNPFIVFDDADINKALDISARAAFSNQGQICLCGSRALVHESKFAQFVEGLTQRAKAIRVGDPLDAETQMGPLVSKVQFDKVSSMVEEARRLGGKFHCGGSPVASKDLSERCKGGYFYQATVITGLDPACNVEQEEIFGPVVTVQSFRDEAHAIALANGTKYGLSASLFTQDLSRAHRVAAAIDSGVVWVNGWNIRDMRTPFGGMKQSGVGREGGLDAMRFFTEPKNVCVAL
ncbi:MAG: aldehyde dehydrogenase [Phycisphaerales bacterium]